MYEIVGNTTATPNPRPDWNQTDETKADYIKNKPLEKGEGEKSILFNDGLASGASSIAGGTTDTELIKSVLGSGYAGLIDKYGNIANISDAVISLILEVADVDCTVEEFKRMLTVSPSEAEGILAIALGASNKAKTAGAVSLGFGNISGAKGYYITAINTTDKTITLSTKQDTAVAPENAINWAVGDRLFIVNDDKYWVEVASVSGNVVTLTDIPFSSLAELKKVSIPLVATYDITNPTERSVVNVDKPESGEVDIGWGAIAIGALNTILGSNAFGVGYKHLIAGDFGVSFGQENQVGYSAGAIGILINALAKCTFGAGCGHTLTEKYQSAVGKYSKENKNALFRVGNGSGNTPSNAMEVLENGTVVVDKIESGEGCEASGSHALAGGYKCKSKHRYTITYGSDLSTSRDFQAVFGYDNKDNPDAYFIVGRGDYTAGNAFEVIVKNGKSSIKVGDTEITEQQALKLLETSTKFDLTKTLTEEEKAEIRNWIGAEAALGCFTFVDRYGENYEFTFKLGMTWRDFLESDYYQGNEFDFNKDDLVDYNGHGVVDEDWHYVTDMDEIINGATYVCERL